MEVDDTVSLSPPGPLAEGGVRTVTRAANDPPPMMQIMAIGKQPLCDSRGAFGHTERLSWKPTANQSVYIIGLEIGSASAARIAQLEPSPWFLSGACRCLIVFSTNILIHSAEHTDILIHSAEHTHILIHTAEHTHILIHSAEHTDILIHSAEHTIKQQAVHPLDVGYILSHV